jgi:ketosteroid isomerase-like protein
MSPNADFVRRIFEAFPRTQKGLREGTLEIRPPIAEDVVWDASDLGLPDMGDGVVHGRDGVRRFWMSWLSAWEEISFDYEIFESGPNVLVEIQQRNRTSTITVDAHYTQVWTFENGEVVHFKLFMNPAAGFEAAGVEQPQDRAS